MDVDEAPSADLLYVTELVDVHDSIKLLNSDDNLGFYTETLPTSKSDEASGQRKRSCLRGTYSAQSIAGLIMRQFEIDILRCENRNFFELCERVDPSTLIQSQLYCLAFKCELCWKFNVTPLSRLT